MKQVPIIRILYRRLRECMGLDQAYIADRLKITRCQLSRYESAKGHLSYEKEQRLGAILVYLGKKRGEMFGDISRMNSKDLEFALAYWDFVKYVTIEKDLGLEA